jgi:hypothetical protein
LIPPWLQGDLVDTETFHLPAKLPDGAARTLRSVADEYRRSMTPATQQERTDILGELRLLTKHRNENVQEARMRFSLLRQHLSEVPAQVLREATKEYAKTNKFFPDGPAEILPFIDRIMLPRKRMTYRLTALAREAEERLIHETKIEKDPLTPEAAAAIIEEFGLRDETVERIKPTGPAKRPTVEDYVAMGVDRATAESCLAQRLQASE